MKVESAETSTTVDPSQAEKIEEQPASTQTEQLIVTRRADGEILSVVKVDASGLRGELSEEDCGQIAGEDEIDEISSALDAAFEAGFVEAFDESDADIQQAEDTGDDPVLERLILLRLLGRRIGGVNVLRRNMLQRLLLRRLIRRHVLRNRKERTTA